MQIDIGCTFAFELPARTHAILMVEPHSSEIDRILHSRTCTSPGITPIRFVDGYGNRCQRFTMGPGRADLAFTAQIEVTAEPDPIVSDAIMHAPEDLPEETLQLLYPSRYCESDQLADLAWQEFGSITEGWARVQAISDWVHDRIEFDYSSSSPNHSALSAIAGGVGVCRDFTHTAIALCRALNIPARYVFGYLPDIGVPDPGVPMDFCAWMEVYLGDRWHTFDPRNNERRIGRVVIGRGRDAADVAMVTSFGKATLLSMTVRAEESSSPSIHESVTSLCEA